jgi:hypothetical protein
MVEEISTVMPVTPEPATSVERPPEPQQEPEAVPVDEDSGKMLDMYA